MEIVFFGNCQIRAIFDLFNRFVQPYTEDVTSFIPNYRVIDPSDMAALARSEVVVEQVLDMETRSSIPADDLSARIVNVPLVSAGFLWPFAGQPHIRNQTSMFLPDGPYSAEMGNSFLNKLIADGVDPEEGARRYIDLDVPRIRNLDRMYELFMERQVARDERCGIDVASVIERHFRDETLFRTPYHPNTRIAIHLARETFERIGVSADLIARMMLSVVDTPFPKDENPIQRSVVEHFKLKSVSPSKCHAFLNEGRFTLQEMALRYMRCDWNPDLAEGLALISIDESSALRLLMESMKAHPEISMSHFAVGELLNRSGKPAEAEAHLRTAISLDKGVARYHHGLGGTLLALGKHQEAMQAAERAIVGDPFNEHYRALRCHILTVEQRYEEADIEAMIAIGLAPRNPHLYSLAATILRNMGLLTKAVDFARTAARLEPGNDGFQNQLAELLLIAGQEDEAIELAKEIAGNDAGDGSGWFSLGKAQAELGDLDAAEENIIRALGLGPSNIYFLVELAHLLERKGDNARAVAAFRQCAMLRPDDPEMHLKLSHAVVKIDDLGRAEAEAKIAHALAPERQDILLHLAGLQLLARSKEAGETIERLLAISPNNAEGLRMREVFRSQLSRRDR